MTYIVTIPSCDKMATEDTRPRWFVNAQRRCGRLADGESMWSWAWNRSLPHKVRIRNGDVMIHFEHEHDVTMFMFSVWCQDDEYAE